MKFALIDRILDVQPGERIRAVKAVSLSEEYLADHFPTFPVLPGVFMLEAMVEAAAWLVRETQDFATSVILLQSAKNVTYKSFVKPGNVLELDVGCRKMSDVTSDFSGSGSCNGIEMVKARFTLRHTNIADHGKLSDDVGEVAAGGSVSSGRSSLDEQLITSARARYALLRA